MKRLILGVSLGLAMWAGAAHSEDEPEEANEAKTNPRAQRLLAEAEKALDDDCNMNECPAFASAAPKLAQAFKIEPHARISWVYCKNAEMARSAGALTPKLWAEAVMMCDATLLTHGDGSVRSSAASKTVDLREWAYSPNNKSRPRLTDPAAAARAVFGEGFQVSTEDDRPSLGWSEADHKKMQGFIRDYYIWVVLRNKLDTQTLFRSDEKLAMCTEIAGLIRDKKQQLEVTQFCEWQAAREANLELFAFRGPEPYKKSEPGKLFQLQLMPDKTVIYEPLLSLAGSKPRDDYDSIMAQGKLLDAIIRNEDHAFYRDAAKLKLRIDKLVKAKRKDVEKAKERRAAKGPKIYFYDRLGREWDIPEPVSKHVDDCSKLIVEAVDKGYSDMMTKVDGEVCTIDKTWAMLKDHCKNALLPGERHTVTAELRRVSYRKTGKQRARIHNDSIELEDIYSSKTGKVLAKASITCGE